MISGLLFLAIIGGIGFALWNGVGRVIDPEERAALEPARVVRSAAIAIGMYLAMLAIAVGIIDLFQAVAGGDRLVGSNSDLARALSLLIVGLPVFGVLARTIDRERATRREAGDPKAGIGWSAHLVAALTTTLIAVLVSAAQVIDDIGEPRGMDRLELAQLAGWFIVWAAYWLGLRPRLGVRGHLHLLIGSILGLGWAVTGIIGLGNDLGSQAYAELFAEPIVTGGRLLQWLLIATVGVATWFWHWRVLDSTRERGIETRPRHSRGWYATVVGAGIVPAVIALLSVVGGAIAGILIWFFGSPRATAVEWFEPAPTVAVVGCVAVAVWAFHRWLLLRDGDPARNEALRFHDYAVSGVGLVAVVTGIALVVGLVIEATTIGSLVASSFDLDNRLIGTLVLLVLGAGLWWRTWDRIDRQRVLDPVAESDSIWRKLYLIIAAGLGSLILAGCSIWIVFALLRDLFDGTLGQGTIEALSAPAGWAIAVLAGVWFHIGVWRSDRVVLESLTPAPPPPPTAADRAPRATAAGAGVRWANSDDHGELFTLQRAAFVDEAVAYATPEVPPLTESFVAFGARMTGVKTLVAVDDTRIVGAVSVREALDHAWLERLMVAPDRRNERLGHTLVDAAIEFASAQGHDDLRAVVGDRNPDLLHFYDSLEFSLIGRTEATQEAPELLVLARRLAPTELSASH